MRFPQLGHPEESKWRGGGKVVGILFYISYIGMFHPVVED